MKRRTAILGLIAHAILGAILLFVFANWRMGIHQSWDATIMLNDSSAASHKRAAYATLLEFQEQLMESPIQVSHGFTLRLDTMREGNASNTFSIRPFLRVEMSGTIPKVRWLSVYDNTISNADVDSARAFLRSQIDIFNAAIQDPARRLIFEDGSISTYNPWHQSSLFPLIFWALLGVIPMLILIAIRPILRNEQ